MVNKEKSKFVRVKCSKCKNSQIVFGNASTKVKCLECDTTIAVPKGGKAGIRARVEEILTD